jgi:hypothetical protein
MADSSIFDNNATTQRLITVSSGTQLFTNSGTDTSYSLDPTDTNDYYRLQVSRRSSLVLTLNSQNGNADIDLLDSSGNPTIGVVQSSKNSGTLADAIVTDPLNPGTYYLRIYTPDTSVSTTYSLSVTTVNTTRADLLWRGYGYLGLWLMNSNSLGSSQTFSVSDPNWQVKGTGDFDGDGQADYVWRNSATGQNIVWFMSNNAYRTYQFLPAANDPTWNIVGVGDFDGDGKSDLLWRNSVTGDNSFWFMDGVALKSSAMLTSVHPSFSVGGIGDFDNDGKLDILWRNYTNGQNFLWFMNGTSYASFATLPTATDVSWKMVGAGDFDGDGKLDIAWRNTSTGQNSVWLMNGASCVGSLSLPAVTDVNWQVSALVTTPSSVDLAGNSMGTAFNIGNLNNSGIYEDTIGKPSDPNDYYKFSLATGSVFNLSLTGLTVDTSVQIVKDLNNNGIIDSQSEIVTAATNSGGTIQIPNFSLTAGTYFIRIFSSSSTATDYSLSVNAASTQLVDLQALTGSFSVTQTNGSALPSSVTIVQSGTSPTVKVNYSLKNNSSTVAPPSFRVSFYLSRDNVITPSDYWFTSNDVVVTNLAAGGSYTNSQTLTLPLSTNPWWGGDQTYYIGMIVDSASEVSEVNESNNTASAPISILGTLSPDVLGGSLSITQSTSAPSQPIRLTGTLRNIGNAATASGFKVFFYFSNDDLRDGSDAFIGTAQFQKMALKSSTTFDSTITSSTAPAYFFSTPTLPPASWSGWRGNGRYYICMWIDVYNSSGEANGATENNQNFGRLTNQFSDFTVIDITNAPNNAV